MNERTGKQTKRAGLTWLGPKNPSDPDFEEDWTITLPQFGRRSSKPSSSRPDEVDDEDEVQPDGGEE